MICQLEGVSFEWRKDEFPENNFDNDKHIGLIAQDVEKIFPDLVKTDNNGYKSVAYDKMTVILLEGLKYQQKKIESQEMESQQIKSELQSLKVEMDQINSMLATIGTN
jgi:hypothetical protein